MCVASACIIDVPGLASSQEECDARTVLRAIFIAQHLGAERVVVYGNDTGIVLMLVYCSINYTAKRHRVVDKKKSLLISGCLFMSWQSFWA